jgi:hypothetical protein
MPLNLVFNELSASVIAPDMEATSQWFTQFAKVLIFTRGVIGSKVLVVPRDFRYRPFGPHYNLSRWLVAAPLHDDIERVRFKRLLDQSVEFESLNGTDLETRDDVEFLHASRRAVGLGIAIELTGVAVSFASSADWNASSLMVEKLWLGDKELERADVSVRHASTTAHLAQLQSFIDQQVRALPGDGRELWTNRQELYPSLDFCESVQPQIEPLAGTEPRFKVLRRSLGELQGFCDVWTDPHFDIKRLNKASGESAQTLANYAQERTFRCPDGLERVFEWHLKRGESRIHFYDFPKAKRLLVGYVGMHLRTWRG